MCFTSCSNNAKTEDPKEHAEEMNEEKFEKDAEKDADRMVEIYCDNLYEIKASENAAMRATTTDVKKLAGMMVAAHTKMNTDLQALATKKNITLPTDITEDQRRKMQDLTEKNGLEYDKEYTKQMKDGHEDAVKVLERTADKSEDAEIKQWATASVPEVRTHLEMVDATLKNVEEVKDADRDSKKEKNTWKGRSDMHDGRHDIHDEPTDKH